MYTVAGVIEEINIIIQISVGSALNGVKLLGPIGNMQCPLTRLRKSSFCEGAGVMNNMQKQLNDHSLRQQVDIMGNTSIDVSTAGWRLHDGKAQQPANGHHITYNNQTMSTPHSYPVHIALPAAIVRIIAVLVILCQSYQFLVMLQSPIEISEISNHESGLFTFRQYPMVIFIQIIAFQYDLSD